MAKRVFFSFHYQDVIDFRVNVVRNHWVTKLNQSAAGFFDASLWEDAKKTSDLAIKRLINGGLDNTSVTCVLIGSQTFNRRWVRYEIIRSIEKGNKILGIHINGFKDKNGTVKSKAPNPFYYLGYKYSDEGNKIQFYESINGKWVEYKDLAPYKISKIAPESQRGQIFRLSSIYPVYDWIENDGYKNFANWVS
ncbi:Thoeris anti-phage system ThsA activator ThsB [Bacillus cereus group sp. Bce026]|uniref:Thoeris anti-phage system ThsA activator ThsB n=1 Tax=Bacillus cereus group sp. Bce026 TaxID=3445242 RepID=UPI003F272F4D